MYKKIPILEASRNDLLTKSKASNKGRQRFKRRVKSKVANQVKQFNSIDMNKLFRDDILTVNISVNGETDNYVVKISFGGFLELLRKEVDRTGMFDLRAVTRALLDGFNKDDVYIHCSCPDFCLDGSTKIKLLNGEVVSVSDMLEKFNNGEEMWVYSSDEKGDFKPGKVSNVWISGYVNNLVKVTLDNDKEILTTPNHRYMLRDGSYKEAKDLYIGQSLMSMCSNYHKVKNVECVVLENDVPVYDISVEDYNNFYVDAGVMLHNCYRFAYWATKNNINSGEPQNSNGKWIRNPDDRLGSGCKHVLLVLSNNSWLIKVASVIKNYAKYMEKYYQQQYADIIYPAIYGKPYEEPVQTSMFDDDELVSDEATLDVSNELGRTSGQFKKGNEYRFTKGPEKPLSGQQELDSEE